MLSVLHLLGWIDDCVEVLRLIRYKIGRFENDLSSQSLGWILKKTRPVNSGQLHSFGAAATVCKQAKPT